jgi:hypothetical protein
LKPSGAIRVFYTGDGCARAPSQKVIGVLSTQAKDGTTMNQLSERDLQTHVPILGWLFIVSNGFLLLLGCLGFLFFGGIGSIAAAEGDGTALAVLGMIGTMALIFFAVLAIPGILAGYGLLRRKTWGRVLGIVVGVLGLINFPIGTVTGAYALWVLFQDAATDYFRPQAATPAA